jgi:hypothetical protein
MRPPRTSRIALLVLALMALLGVPAHSQTPGRRPGEKYALLIAVRQYEPSELRSLKYTEADVGDFLSAGARTSGQRGHFGRPRQLEKPKQVSAREELPRHLLYISPLVKLSALVCPR